MIESCKPDPIILVSNEMLAREVGAFFLVRIFFVTTEITYFSRNRETKVFKFESRLYRIS